MLSDILKISIFSAAAVFFSGRASAQCVTISGLPDTITTCKNSTVQLNATVSVPAGPLITQDTIWNPAAGLSNPNIINPVATIGTTSVLYTLTIQALTPTNYVVNGNFNAGATGFTTSYIPGTGGTYGLLSNEGQYAVTSNPNLVHTNFVSFFDHTTGVAAGSSMMVINGAAASNVNVWCQTITVIPNSFYDFSAWGASTTPSNPAILQFAINGIPLGTPFALPTTTGQWVQFHALWFSGTNTSITICITDQQTALSGNDFAIDDIAFRQQCFTTDSVYIRVTNLQPGINKVIKLGCTSDTVNFTALNLGGDVPTQYKWDFGDATASQLQNPQHVYLAQGQYTIKLITKRNGCSDSTTTTIDTRHPLQAAFTVDHDSVCIGTPIQVTQTDVVTGPGTYYWNFGDGQTDNTASPAGHSYTAAGIYTITHAITDQIPCHDTVKTTVSVFPSPFTTFDIVDTVFCLGGATTVTGTATPGFSQLNWNFGDGFSINGTYKNRHSYEQTGNYIITLKVDYPLCPSVVKTHTVQVLPQPIVNLGRDTTICPHGDAIKITNEVYDPAVTYLWSTGQTGAAIVINDTGNYWLRGVSSGGCTAADSLLVSNACYLNIPNSFTPNGDGMNDYFFPRQLLASRVEKFSMKVFNRWGETIFETTNVNGRGWDGSLNGKNQNTGTYIYTIIATIEGLGEQKYQGNVTLLR